MADVDYQRAGLVRQLLAERENVVAYGNEPRVKQIDRQLADLGYEKPKPARVARDEPPQGRATKQAARHQTTAKTDDD
jgi:hypothetical protein